MAGRSDKCSLRMPEPANWIGPAVKPELSAKQQLMIESALSETVIDLQRALR